MNIALGIISFIGVIGFIVAWVYSNENHEITRFVTPLWFVFGVAMAFGTLWSFSKSLQGLGILPEVMNSMQIVFISSGVAMLFAVAYISYRSTIKLM